LYINVSICDDEKEHTFRIDLLSNKYVDHLFEKHEISGNWSWQRVAVPSELDYDADRIKELWDGCLSCYYKFLDLIGAKDLAAPPETFDFTNKHTNTLHRIFTTYNISCTYYGVEYEFKQEALDEVEELNVLIHELEKYIPNKTIDDFKKDFGKVAWIDIQGDNHEKETRFNFYESDREFVNNFSEYCNVFCIKHILGKDHLIGYLNEDESHHWDITNFHLGYCGFCLDFRGDLQRVWKYPPLKDWAGEVSLSYYPVGRISEEDMDVIRGLSSNVKVVGVEYING
jgi:hypothetical protein